MREVVCEENSLQTLNEDFRCPVCLDLVIKPEKCNKCEKKFCNGCIFQTRVVREQCPHCRNEPFETKKLNPYEQKYLNQLTFRCSWMWKNTLPYQLAIEQAEHGMSMIECWLCGKVIDQKSDHIVECSNVLRLHMCPLFDEPHFVKSHLPCSVRSKRLKELSNEVKKLKRSLDYESKINV
jgi:hypothetical protein